MNKYVIFSFFCLIISACATNPNSNSSEGIGYQGHSRAGDTVEETLSKLKGNPEIKIRSERGWTIATLESGRIIWSFTPKDHPAHPSFVKREVIEKDGSIYLETNAKCSAEKSVCDKLVQDFIQLNNRVRENMSKH